MPGPIRPMAQAYRVEPLSPDRARIAYPVVAALYPTLGQESWQRYARTLTESPQDQTGALGLSTEAGYFCGLLIFRNDREPWHEPRLTVDLFVAIDVTAVHAATLALLAAAEAKAAALACTVVQIRIEQGPDLVQRIRQAGYRPAGEMMAKQVAAPGRIN